MLKCNRDALSAPGGGELCFRKVFGFIVAALDVNLGAGELKRLQRHFFRENHDKIDGFERCDDSRTVGFRIDRTVVALAEHSDGGVAVDGEHEAPAQRSCLREIGDVSAVKDVEDAVGEDDRFGELCRTKRQLFHRADLLLK